MGRLLKPVVVMGVAVVPLAFLFYPVGYAMVIGCGPPQKPPVEASPIPDFNKGLFSFPRFDLPAAKPPDSVPLTVLSIIPEYKDTEHDRFSSGDVVSATGSGGQGTMTRDMAQVFRSFAGSAGEDVQALLVAKGMTAKGPFPLDEVTFPDKKGAELTVLMQLIFDIQYSDQKYERDELYTENRLGKVYSGKMSVGIKVYYYLLEPLSEERMWVKKLDLGTQEVDFVLAKDQERYVSGTHTTPGSCGSPGTTVTDYGWRDNGKLLYDQRGKIFSDMLKGAYPRIMKTAWKFFDADEMLTLKEKAAEIRDKWGSSSYRRGAPTP